MRAVLAETFVLIKNQHFLLRILISSKITAESKQGVVIHDKPLSKQGQSVNRSRHVSF